MYFHPVLAGSLEYYLKKWPEFYLVIILFFIFYSIRWYLIKHNNQVMVHWPILDMLPSLIQNAHRIHDWTVDISKVFGGTKVGRGPFFARLEILYTCDPRNIEYILRTNVSNFPKGPGYKETFNILGDGLFNVDSHLWHAQRRMARMTFTSKNVRSIIANMSQKVVQDALLPLLAHVAKQSSMSVDLEDVFLRYTFDTSFSIIFGRNPNNLSISFPPNEFAKAMDDATEALLYRHVVPKSWWKLCRWLKIGHEKKMEKAWRTIDQYLMQYIVAKREDMDKGTEESDLLQVYMSLKEGEKDEQLSKISSDKFLRDTALTLLFAGRDTTASSLAWFFWLVLKNPSVEAKILEELNLVFSKNMKGENGLIRTKRPWVVFDADDLTGMVYLHAALCESLRLYPPVPLNRRGAVKDDVLPDGTVVKSGMTIIYSKYAMGRMEWVWGKDCLEFRPERWIDENGKLDHDTMSRLIAFGIGPRTCVGKEMAFVLMKSAASAMLFNFHIEVLEGQNIQPKPSIVLQMKNGLLVRIKERK